MRQTRNARFWVWVNGWVKLTLKPDQRLSVRYGGPCEEGYHYCCEVFQHDGDGVTYEVHTQSRDCDGRMDTSSESFCPLERLKWGEEEAVSEGPQTPANPYGFFPIYFNRPDWGRAERSQRDYAAEAAGY